MIQLLERLKFYAGFEINDQSGSGLTDHEMTDTHYKKYGNTHVYIYTCTDVDAHVHVHVLVCVSFSFPLSLL